jgi:hypothetical protein
MTLLDAYLWVKIRQVDGQCYRWTNGPEDGAACRTTCRAVVPEMASSWQNANPPLP